MFCRARAQLIVILCDDLFCICTPSCEAMIEISSMTPKYKNLPLWIAIFSIVVHLFCVRLFLDSFGGSMQDLRLTSKVRMNRMKTSAHIPTDEELAAIKVKKKVKIMEIQRHLGDCQ